MTLPIAISVPHAGLRVPSEAVPYCQLTHDEIIKDGDEGAAEIYDLEDEVAQFITTDIARAIVDLNREVDDRRADGIVKTHTCWNVPVYREFPPESVISRLLEEHYHPYHARLTEFTRRDLLFAVDCHTMAAAGPPIGPDPGTKRPAVCLGDVAGKTFPVHWMPLLHRCFADAFSGLSVTINQPFSGGHITQTHGQEMPWVQLELSRDAFASDAEKRTQVLLALTNFRAAVDANRKS